MYVDREVIRLTRNGVWIADDAEITHEPTRDLFARSLKKDEQGYFLQIGRETKRIEVEDTAYFVQRFYGTPQGAQGIELQINDGTSERLDPLTLSYRPNRLTARIKGKSEEAKFLSTAYNELLGFLQEDETAYFLVFQEGSKLTRVNLLRKPSSV